MFYEIFKFELRGRMKKISTYIYFAIFFSFSFIIMLSMGGVFKSFSASVGSGGQGNVFANAPFVIYSLINVMSHFGIIITAGMMGNAAYRDFEDRTYTLYFSYPIKKYAYICGRFAGTLVALLFVFSGTAVGALMASWMPFVMAEKFTAFRLSVYVQPFLVGVIPNIIFAGGIFYALALRVRKRLPVYVTAVGMLMGFLLAANLVGDIKNKLIAALIDPFGNIPVQTIVDYWTPAEKNTLLIPLSGNFLLNRLLWLGIGLLVMWLGTRKFKLSYLLPEKKRAAKIAVDTDSDTLKESREPAGVPVMPALQRTFSAALHRQQFFTLFKNEFLSVVKSIYFSVIVLFGVMFVFIVGMQNLGTFSGTSIYPLTYRVLEISSGTFMLFIIIILTFYSGELVWKERDKKFAQINDAMPVPNWAQFFSKLGALMLVLALLNIVILACGVMMQALKGYYNFEIGLYLKELFGIRLLDYLLFAALAIFVQVLVNNKYLGHFVMVVYYIVIDFLPNMGIEHKLFLFPESTGYMYSDMNGYGHFLGPYFLFKLYWAGFALMLVLIAYLFRVRGTDTSFKVRLKKAKKRFTRGAQLFAAAGLILFLTMGSIIFYNTNVLNDFESRWEEQERVVSYEKKYKQYENLPQPRITDVRVDVDIFPMQRGVDMRGSYVLKNKTTTPIPAIHVGISRRLTINKMAFDLPASVTAADKDMGYYIYTLKQPLNPDETIKLDFDVSYRPRGFMNSGRRTRVVYNGTFLHSYDFCPSIGYNPERELSDDDDRKNHDLKPKPRMAPVDDLKARGNTYISHDSDWVTFETVVSTVKDQVALAPGYLFKEWVEGERRFFHYKMDKKILNFFSFISARYQVQRDKWKDVDIEIYYHEGHDYNVQRMIEAIKKSLAYYTTHFSPYQHSLVRIIEFPRYASFAQSFPTTIPYSEQIGFVARIEEGDVDYPFEVTAHEVAHQWWAHQVIGGNVQGATLLSEVLAQYSTLMVARENFPEKIVRKSLRYDMDRYFRGRARERKKEVPLMLIENQGYLHYNKGIIIMNALQDYIGADRVNAALARFIKDTAYTEPPYPNSIEFLEYLREATPDHLKYIITDMFETITLYEFKALDAAYKKLENGKYEVTVTVQAKKLRADELGKETEIPIDDWLDIGVLDKDGDALYLKKHKIDNAEKSFTIVVDSEPVQAGIDPFNKMLDRRLEDNVVNVEGTSEN
ncbi:MAG: ABC transporter permease [Candidatus Aminicenantes bacterium]|nr:ABC transporter permease [Candidatus Aminicenantes bacterium]